MLRTLRIRRLKSRIAWNEPCFQDHDGFHQAGQTRRRLRMPYVTFDLNSALVSVTIRCDLHTDPMCSGLSSVREGAKTEETPATSTGSPAKVPVPWHSRYDVSEKSVMLAFSYAVRTAAAWASALGDAIPGVRPLWLLAVPRMTARMGSPSRMASSSRFNITALIPSAFMYPSALASNV